MELGNVLSPWSYGPDDKVERVRLIGARNHARKLRRWIFRHYRLVDEKGQAVDYKESFYWPYLVQQTRALLNAKELADKSKCAPRSGYYESSTASVESVVKRSLSKPKALRVLFEKSARRKVCSFAWTGPRFTVVKIVPPLDDKAGACWLPA